MNGYRKLTRKELQVLELLAKGYLIKEGADIFGVSIKAMDYRIDRVRKKLKVPNHVSTPAILPILALNKENLVPYENTRNPPTELSERQREVLSHIAAGLTQDQVAKLLRIAPNSVESHMESVRGILRRKLGRKKITLGVLIHYAIAHRITPLQFIGNDIFAE